MNIKEADDCRYDLVALGEVMLRLDPGEQRIRNARTFSAWEGGGEYNVARALRRCFGKRTAIISALADNDVGWLIEEMILQGGVDTSMIQFAPYDGVGRSVRNGLNFTERGYGVRGARGVSDRGNSAASQLSPDAVDWDHLFGTRGVRWLHTGGIYAGLSQTTPAVIETAIKAARRHGTIVSYDLNYRASLWQALGGPARCQEVNRRLIPYVDVVLGNEEDFTACLGLEVPGVDASLRQLPTEGFRDMIAAAHAEHPHLKLIATTLRTVKTATLNDWGAIAWSEKEGFVESTRREHLEILDRVGGGDGFASGLIYGMLEGFDLRAAVEYGAAHGALAMTTPGDTSTARLDEVASLAAGATPRANR